MDGAAQSKVSRRSARFPWAHASLDLLWNLCLTPPTAAAREKAWGSCGSSNAFAPAPPAPPRFRSDRRRLRHSPANVGPRAFGDHGFLARSPPLSPGVAQPRVGRPSNAGAGAQRSCSDGCQAAGSVPVACAAEVGGSRRSLAGRLPRRSARAGCGTPCSAGGRGYGAVALGAHSCGHCSARLRADGAGAAALRSARGRHSLLHRSPGRSRSRALCRVGRAAQISQRTRRGGASSPLPAAAAGCGAGTAAATARDGVHRPERRPLDGPRPPLRGFGGLGGARARRGSRCILWRPRWTSGTRSRRCSTAARTTSCSSRLLRQRRCRARSPGFRSRASGAW